MCGIFGIVLDRKTKVHFTSLSSTVDDLFRLSESRGKEAAGLAVQTVDAINVYKVAVSASCMLRSREYKGFIEEALKGAFNEMGQIEQPISLIGHARLVTDGLQSINVNNQPVIKDGLVGVHNGIVTNVGTLWQAHPEIQRCFDVDTEVLLSLIRHYMKDNESLPAATKIAFSKIEGTASVAILAEDHEGVTLATNNGSLYVSADPKQGVVIFASERYILEKLSSQGGINRPGIIRHMNAGQGLFVGNNDMIIEEFTLGADQREVTRSQGRQKPVKIVDATTREQEARESLRRCTQCVLPETFPFIHFDESGVCNYCRDYPKTTVNGHKSLDEAVAPFRGSSGEPDCMIMVSGGRDSSYGMHYVKTVLGMNPIAYTYDWGMITDLARRNIARLCGKLGVEHILVSADIPRKRRYIRKNIDAWLKRPDLGMVPLFMAGDKQYYYYANQVREHNDISLVFVCECPLELTKFKAGFCGVDESHHRIFDISMLKKIKLGWYYLRQYMSNPSYINASLFDSIFAFWSSYFIPHNYLFLYRYVEWKEDEIVSTLIREYNWEIDPEAPSTWRIGDGTAPFYNYIYYTVAGFTENDTLRSNQIREGVISRDEALALVQKENKPRMKAMEWYAKTVGFNLDEAIRMINAIPKLYMKS
jgi:glutamine---fructose-6-phosphate transaminase (isomerizing)